MCYDDVLWNIFTCNHLALFGVYSEVHASKRELHVVLVPSFYMNYEYFF